MILFNNQGNQSRNRIYEASVNFDYEDVQPFLEQISKIIPEGFGASEIESVISLMKSLEINDEKGLTFSVLFNGKYVDLRIEIFMDDVDSPDVYFYSTLSELAKKIQDQMGGDEMEN